MHNALNLIAKIKNNLLKPQLIFLCLGVFFIGCQNIQYPDKPKDLIPEDKMVEVLIDVHFFNAAKSVNRLPLQQTGMTPNQFIYEKHNIDSIQYEESNAFYGANLDAYERIHTRVKDYLERQKTEIDTLISRKKREEDSIKNTTDSIKLKEVGFETTRTPPQVIKKKIFQNDSIN